MAQYIETEYAPRRSTNVTTINRTQYELGKKLGEGGFGSVYAGRRLHDGLQVAIKTVMKKNVKYINFTDRTEPVPLEVALQMYANQGPREPEILQLLEWEDYDTFYAMVLECFSPCMDVLDYRTSNGGRINEETAKVIMRAATKAAYACMERGVFHRDIKLENLLINPDTLEVKLIDFGCGAFLQTAPYTTFSGTQRYCCPEFLRTGKYYAGPATVYSLGMLLFAMVCGEFPKPHDHWMINNGGAFHRAGLSEDCCSLIQACMLEDQAQRINLDEILVHKWLNVKKSRMPWPPVCSERAEMVDNPVAEPNLASGIEDNIFRTELELANMIEESPVINTEPDLASVIEDNILRTELANMIEETRVINTEPDLASVLEDNILRTEMELANMIEETPVINTEPECDSKDQLDKSAPRQSATITTINTTQYEFGKLLGKGGFGSVFAARCLDDGLQVALKTVIKKNVKYINFKDLPEPVPLEIALQMYANQGPRVPEILQLLEWEDYQRNYIMVLERFSPCMDVLEYRKSNGGRISEKIAKVIMRAATKAAYACMEHGVFHRDIKLENLLINPDTLEVKLIDFGCGAFLQTAPYTTFAGTRRYFCPEYFETGKYNAEPATVYSLGVMLFAMVCGEFPKTWDHWMINSGRTFSRAGLSEDCCLLIQACMLEDPEERVHLDKILVHKWLKDKKDRMSQPPKYSKSAEDVKNPVDSELDSASETEESSGIDSELDSDTVIEDIIVNSNLESASYTEDNEDDSKPELATMTGENPVINTDLVVATEEELDINVIQWLSSETEESSGINSELDSASVTEDNEDDFGLATMTEENPVINTELDVAIEEEHDINVTTGTTDGVSNSHCMDSPENKGGNTINAAAKIMIWAANKAAYLYNAYNVMCIM